MKLPSYKESWIVWLLLIATALLFLKLNAAPIYILDEAKNAQCAKEMLQRNDWVVPTFNSELRTDKPPLHYFFMMLSYKIWGISAFSARFFSAVMGLLTIIITYLYTKRIAGSFIAFCSALVLVTSTHFLFEFRLSVPDPYLIFFITLGLFSAYIWLQEDKVTQLYLSTIAFGLATLTKGPVALVIPGLCLLIWIIWQKKWKTVWTWHLLFSLLIMFAIVMPWYVAVHKVTHGAWTYGFFVEHNYNRYIHAQEGHGGFFFIPILFILIGLLPFISFIGEVIKNYKQIFNKEPEKFAALVVIVFLVFFCFSGTKLPNYIMPCYPFAAIILGNFIALISKNRIQSRKYPFYILLTFSVIIPVAGYFVIQQEPEAEKVKWIAFTLIVAPAILFIAIAGKKKWNWNRNFFAIVISYVVFNSIGFDFVYPTLYSQNPVTKTLAIIKGRQLLFAYKNYNPAYNFYINSSVVNCQDTYSLQNLLKRYPGALVVSRKEYLDSLNLLNLEVIAIHHDLFESPTTVLLTNKLYPN